MSTPEQLQARKLQRVRRQLGYPSSLVDAARAREWLLYLKSEGTTYRLIHEATGISETGLVPIAKGRRTTIFRETEAKILAVQPVPHDLHVGGMRIGPIGSRRRLQALSAEGFIRSWLAQACDMVECNITHVTYNRVSYILTPNAERIAEVYDKYAGTNPEELGISALAVKRAKNRAERLGFVPSVYWDDSTIGDPEGFPDLTGKCGTVAGRHLHRIAGTPVCVACMNACTEDNRMRKQRQRDIRAGLVEPVPREGRDTGVKINNRWNDDVLVSRLRADFELWMDSQDMEAKYGTSIGNLKKIATRDGLWWHEAVSVERRGGARTRKDVES